MNGLDILGQVLWVAVFLSPLITIPIWWKFRNLSKVWRIIGGVISAVPFSHILLVELDDDFP